MQPAFPEDYVLQHNLQVIQEAGKIVGSADAALMCSQSSRARLSTRRRTFDGLVPLYGVFDA